MASRPQFSAQTEFGQWVISDLKRAGCGNQQLAAIVQATVGTTITFLRWNRRKALATNPNARQLAKQQFDFETALLRSVVLTLPKARKRGRKKGQKDPATVEKFIAIMKLLSEGKNWTQIANDLQQRPGLRSDASAYKKLYNRHLPQFLRLVRSHFRPDVPEEVFLKLAIRAAKRRPGRPKRATPGGAIVKQANLPKFYGE
jgi:hypothetical protein